MANDLEETAKGMRALVRILESVARKATLRFTGAALGGGASATLFGVGGLATVLFFIGFISLGAVAGRLADDGLERHRLRAEDERNRQLLAAPHADQSLLPAKTADVGSPIE